MMNVNMDGAGKLIVRTTYVAPIAVIVSTTNTQRDVVSDKILFLAPMKLIERIFLIDLVDDVSGRYTRYL
jgi:hypothetical protein